MSSDDKLFEELHDVLIAAADLFEKNFSVSAEVDKTTKRFMYRSGAFFVITPGRPETEQQAFNCSAEIRMELAHALPALWDQCVSVQSGRNDALFEAIDFASRFIRSKTKK